MPRRLRKFEANIILLSAVAFGLLGLARPVFEEIPLLGFSCTLFLFMVPGAVLVRWFFDEYVSGLATLPISFALSASIFGFIGVPFLILHRSLASYLWIAGAIVVAFLVAVVFRMLYERGRRDNNGVVSDGSSFNWLWIPFLSMGVLLILICWAKEPSPYEDIWVYLADTRELLGADRLALHEPYFGHAIGTSRLQINGWLLECAALSRISGVDVVALVTNYLAPTLVGMSVLAFYALARIILKSETAALLCGSLYTVVLLGFITPMDVRFFLISRTAEDKIVAWFLLLPVTLAFAYLFLESRKLRCLLAFAFLCWAVVAVHPVGLAMIGMATAGFGFLHLAFNWREKAAWIGTVSLGGALLSVLLVPLLYLLITGDSLVAVLTSADLDYSDPQVETNMVFVRPGWHGRILELGGGYYIVGYSARLLAPLVLAAFLGLPFLLWRSSRRLAAQLLAGTMLVPSIVCFVPPVATFFGNHIVLPGQMWRLAWPIPLAAVLTIGWILWEAIRFTQSRLERLGATPSVGRLLPLLLVCTLMAVTTLSATEDAQTTYEAAYRASRGKPSSGKCFDPIFHWMQSNIEKPSVVLAPDSENTCIPAYSAHANVVSLRGRSVLRFLPALNRRAPGEIDVPQGMLDVQNFYDGIIQNKARRIIVRHEVDYVMISAKSHRLSRKLERWPGFTPADTPASGYKLYTVERQRLDGRNPKT